MRHIASPWWVVVIVIAGLRVGLVPMPVEAVQTAWFPVLPALHGGETNPALPKLVTVKLGENVMMDLVLVPAGSFMMGSDGFEEDEKPVHKVNISRPFYMGKYEVTQEQWTALIHDNPTKFVGPQRPVENLKWEDCQKFLEVLSARYPGCTFTLPTEAQWEYACRAGSTTEFCFGSDEGEMGEYAWYVKNSENTTHPVGQKHANAWGLYDMHGNAYEWCQDWDGPYAGSEPTDPRGPASGTKRIMRGGSWRTGAKVCRSANRPWTAPPHPPYKAGFRVVVGVEIASQVTASEPPSTPTPKKDKKDEKPKP
jgi:formylglycine-generating enzyme required for sulfatase activity